jgi:hypothetical protein
MKGVASRIFADALQKPTGTGHYFTSCFRYEGSVVRDSQHGCHASNCCGTHAHARMIIAPDVTTKRTHDQQDTSIGTTLVCSGKCGRGGADSLPSTMRLHRRRRAPQVPPVACQQSTDCALAPASPRPPSGPQSCAKQCSSQRAPYRVLQHAARHAESQSNHARAAPTCSHTKHSISSVWSRMCCCIAGVSRLIDSLTLTTQALQPTPTGRSAALQSSFAPRPPARPCAESCIHLPSFAITSVSSAWHTRSAPTYAFASILQKPKRLLNFLTSTRIISVSPGTTGLRHLRPSTPPKKNSPAQIAHSQASRIAVVPLDQQAPTPTSVSIVSV